MNVAAARNPPTKTRIWAKGAFWVYLATLAVGAAYGTLLYFQAKRAAARQPVPPPPTAQLNVPAPTPANSAATTPPSTVENDYRSLWVRLTYAQHDVDKLQKFVALMVAISALFGIALGVNAYINRQESGEVKEVKDDAELKLERLKAEIRADFPAVGNMEATLERLWAELAGGLRVELDWVNFYHPDLEEADRQPILLTELRVAGFRYFDLRAHKTQVGRVYHGLAIFYASRYADEHRKKLPELEASERARRYFEMATRQNTGSVVAKKDYGGFFTIDEMTPPAFQKP